MVTVTQLNDNQDWRIVFTDYVTEVVVSGTELRHIATASDQPFTKQIQYLEVCIAAAVARTRDAFMRDLCVSIINDGKPRLLDKKVE